MKLVCKRHNYGRRCIFSHGAGAVATTDSPNTCGEKPCISKEMSEEEVEKLGMMAFSEVLAGAA